MHSLAHKHTANYGTHMPYIREKCTHTADIAVDIVWCGGRDALAFSVDANGTGVNAHTARSGGRLRVSSPNGQAGKEKSSTRTVN